MTGKDVSIPTARKHPGRPKGLGTMGGAQFTVRLPPLLMARLDAYCQGTQSGLAPRRRAEIVRVALEYYLSGPVLAPVLLGQDHEADHFPMVEARSLPQTTQRKDNGRTTGRTGKKRPLSQKG